MKNKESTKEFWKKYRESIYNFIRIRVNDDDVAEDIVQDVLIKVYENLKTLDDQKKILPWIYQITRNTIVDYYRKKQPTERIAEEIATYDEFIEGNAEKELAQCILPMIDQLPSNYREVIKMFEFDGFLQRDIAQSKNLSLSATKSRIQRGRKLLKKMFIKCCSIELNDKNKILDYQCNDC